MALLTASVSRLLREWFPYQLKHEPVVYCLVIFNFALNPAGFSISHREIDPRPGFEHNKLGYEPIPSFSLDAHHVPLCATYLLGCCARWSTVCGNLVQKREKAFQVSHSGSDSMFWCQELFIFGQQDVSQTRLVTSSLLYSCQLNILNPVLDCPCLALRATAASLAE